MVEIADVAEACIAVCEMSMLAWRGKPTAPLTAAEMFASGGHVAK